MTIDELVVVSAHLPTTAPTRGFTAGLWRALRGLSSGNRPAWVGLVTDRPAPPPTAAWNYNVVAAPEGVLGEAIAGFSDQTLWPLYHDLADLAVFEQRWWDGYVGLNQRLADEVALAAPSGGTIWVHDLQLQLVPLLLRQQRSDLGIGFFLHVPFPNLDLFRRLPWRRQIIKHLLQADLVGFQDPDSARNFTACAAAFGDLTGARGAELEVGDHRCRVEVHPFGVGANTIQETSETLAVADEAKVVRQTLGSPSLLLLALDQGDHSSGADLALKGFRGVLASGEVDPLKSVLVYVRPGWAGAGALSARTQGELDRLISQLNADYGALGRPVVHTVDSALTWPTRIALYRAADVMVVTTRRCGMSMEALEYLASRVDNTGSLVLSEFTGAAKLLDSADLVNPFDATELEIAILRTLRRSPADRARRMTQLRRVVHRNDDDHWANGFIRSLKRARNN